MKIRGVKKQYHGKTVVDSVSFEIQKGKVTALIGPNGAGKTTAIKIMTGLLQAEEGSVLINGKDALADPDQLKSVLDMC